MDLVLSIIILVFVVIGFVSGKYRLGLVGMTGAILLNLTGVLTFSETFAYLSNGNIVMIAGMFIMSGALSKTSLVSKLRDGLLKRAGKGNSLVWLYLIACMIMIQFILPTPLIGMMLPFMAILDKDSNVKPSQILLPGTMVAFMMQGFAPFGIGTAFWGMFNGYLEAGGTSLRLNILDYGKVLIVPALIALVYLSLYGWKKFPALDADSEMLGSGKEQAGTLDKKNEKLVYIVFVLVVLGMIFSNVIPFDINVLPAVGVVILMFLKIIDLNDVKNSINLDVCFMIVGIQAVAAALQKTGAGTMIANLLLNLLGGNPPGIVVLIVFYFTGALLTQFMSNIGTMNIFCPLAVITAISQGLDPRAFCLAIAAGCNAAMLTPNASPSTAVAFGAGHYKMKDVLKVNLPLWIIYGVAAIFMANLIYPVG